MTRDILVGWDMGLFPPKAGPAPVSDRAAQVLDQLKLETFQEWKWHSLLGWPAPLPHLYYRKTVSSLYWGPELMQHLDVVWCVPYRGGQSILLLSRLCPCSYFSEAAGCLCYQGKVHTITSSRSLLKMLKWAGLRTDRCSSPLGGLWVGYNALWAWPSNCLLTHVVVHQSSLFFCPLSGHCVCC